MCVRINHVKKLPLGVWVNGKHSKFFQSFEYEGILLLCFKCGMVGHEIDTCPMAKTIGFICNPIGHNAPSSKEVLSSREKVPLALQEMTTKTPFFGNFHYDGSSTG